MWMASSCAADNCFSGKPNVAQKIASAQRDLRLPNSHRIQELGQHRSYWGSQKIGMAAPVVLNAQGRFTRLRSFNK